jgi:hypothetical protein
LYAAAIHPVSCCVSAIIMYAASLICLRPVRAYVCVAENRHWQCTMHEDDGRKDVIDVL